MHVVTMLNQKGGVGKTSTAYHLAGALARMGRRVLLLDVDPQASLTQGFFGPDATRGIDPAETVAALFDPRLEAIPAAIVRSTGIDGVALVPGSEALTAANITPPAEWSTVEQGVADFLAEVRDDFDLALIDCPPNLLCCSWSALVAADSLVIPLQAEDFGAQGLGPVHRCAAAVRSGPNPALRLAGHLLTMFDKRLAIHLTYEAMLRQLYAGDVFTATVPRAKDFVEAVASRRPVSHDKPRSAAAKAMVAVAEELLTRIAIPAAGERSVA